MKVPSPGQAFYCAGANVIHFVFKLGLILEHELVNKVPSILPDRLGLVYLHSISLTQLVAILCRSSSADWGDEQLDWFKSWIAYSSFIICTHFLRNETNESTVTRTTGSRGQNSPGWVKFIHSSTPCEYLPMGDDIYWWTVVEVTYKFSQAHFI